MRTTGCNRLLLSHSGLSHSALHLIFDYFHISFRNAAWIFILELFLESNSSFFAIPQFLCRDSSPTGSPLGNWQPHILHIFQHSHFNLLFLQHGLLFMKNANETRIESRRWQSVATRPPMALEITINIWATNTLTNFWSIFFFLLHQNTGHLTTHGAEYHHQRGNPATNP